MIEHDAICSFVIENCDVRGVLVHLDESWRTAAARAEYPAVVLQLLGEAFSAAALMSAMIKFQGKLTLQIRGPGPVHLLVVQVTDNGQLRGLARWQQTPVEGSLQNLFGGDARMTITVEADSMGLPHQGIVELVGESLADALRNYFTRSEQLDTVFHFAVSEQSTAGMLLQRMPDASIDSDGDGWSRAVQIADTLSADELLSLTREALLHRLYHQDVVRLFKPDALKFECACSRQRTSGMLKGLGEAEVQDILAEQGSVSITCEFCAEEYHYDAVDVGELFHASLSGGDSQTRH